MATSYADTLPAVSDQLQKQLDVKDAYARAVNALKLTRTNRQIRSGLQTDWSVDPRLQYGTYQAMLQGQGSQLDDALMASQERGLFGRGLGNQNESMLRYRAAVENLQFKQQLADWENEYQKGMLDAENERNSGLINSATPDYGNDSPPPDTQAPSGPLPINSPLIPGSAGYDWGSVIPPGYSSQLPPGTLRLPYAPPKKRSLGGRGYQAQ